MNTTEGMHTTSPLCASWFGSFPLDNTCSIISIASLAFRSVSIKANAGYAAQALTRKLSCQLWYSSVCERNTLLELEHSCIRVYLQAHQKMTKNTSTCFAVHVEITKLAYLTCSFQRCCCWSVPNCQVQQVFPRCCETFNNKPVHQVRYTLLLQIEHKRVPQVVFSAERKEPDQLNKPRISEV